MSSSGTLDGKGNISRFIGSIQSEYTTYTINGKKVTANRAGLIFVTDGYYITEIIGLEDGDWVSGDINRAQFTVPNGSVTVNDITYTLTNDLNGYVNVIRNVISDLDAGATLTFSKAGYYNVNGCIFMLDENQPIYGIFDNYGLSATAEKRLADELNHTKIEPGDTTVVINANDGKSIFDYNSYPPIKNDPNASEIITAGQQVHAEVGNGQAFLIYGTSNYGMVWQNGNGTTETGGNTEVENYDASTGSGIQTNQNTRDDLVNAFANGTYNVSGTSFTNSAGGKSTFNNNTSNSGDLAADIERVNIENSMLANFYTLDGKINQVAWTDNQLPTTKVAGLSVP